MRSDDANSGTAWRHKPWRAHYLQDARTVIDEALPETQDAIADMIQAILANQTRPAGYRTQQTGLFSERWKMYRSVSSSGVAISYCPIEHAPPVYFRIVIIVSITTLVN